MKSTLLFICGILTAVVLTRFMSLNIWIEIFIVTVSALIILLIDKRVLNKPHQQ